MTSPWIRSGAVVAAFTLVTPLASLLARLPGAHADAATEFYMDLLSGLEVYHQFDQQTLLEEGSKVCDATRHGASEDSVTEMVQSDLRISTYPAYRLVTAAELGLNCRSLKLHGDVTGPS